MALSSSAKELPVGLFDGASDLLEKGSAGISRVAKNYSLDAQIKDLERRRQVVLARLGSVLYESFRLDSDIRASNEALFSSIEDLDRQISQLEFEQKNLEKQKAITSPQTVICNKCGAEISSDDLFCQRCGARIVRRDHNASDNRNCPKCGATVAEGNQFCTFCGMKV